MGGSVCVLGLSDIGRSPRLQNHAVSLAKQAHFAVDVVGYSGSMPLSALSQDSNIQIHCVPELPTFLQKLPRLLALPFKALFQLVQLLLIMLFKVQKPDYILLQVPPAIPCLLLCCFVCAVRRSRLVIDWHNFAFTLMALSHGKQNMLVRMAARHEKFWGKRGNAHLCVTKAMQAELRHSWGISATVFHDRAPSSFRPCSLQEQHALWKRLEPALMEAPHPQDCIAASMPLEQSRAGDTASFDSSQEPQESTICTEMRHGKLRLIDDRPALIVSSTSWTPDEDFRLLLDAAVEYDRQYREGDLASKLPRLLILVTGKGPQKGMYLEMMRALDLRRVAFRTLWLDPEDYPLLLGSCDAGVSLHTSSSGLDLPMKVVDMFGCGLPVFTAAYPCISELVQDGINGLHFSSAKELGQQLVEAFHNFPRHNNSLRQLRQAVLGTSGKPTWESEWERVVLPVFTTEEQAKVE